MTSGRHRNVVAALVALAMGLAACSPAGSDNSDPGATGSSASETFVVARTGDIDKLDPHLATAFQSVQTVGLIYNRLLRVDGSGELVPGLATKWTVSPDGKTVTFILREEVTWQDGAPFISADVKASIERILDEKTGAVQRTELAVIDSIDTPDDTTVVLNLSEPSHALLYALSTVNSSILHAEDIEADTVGKTPNGTGPFSFESWKPGRAVVLTANDKYFDGAPAIKTLEFRIIPSESAILSGMKANAFQIGILSDPAVANQADGNDNFQLNKQPLLSYHALMLNGRRGPLTDQRVRQAISCAINREQLIDTAAFGDGKATGPITSPQYQYSPTDGLPCRPGDVEAAKKLMAQAGHEDGITLDTIVITGEYATAVKEAESLQSQLKKIDVHLKLQQLSTSPYVEAWLDADFDAAVALNRGYYDPYNTYSRFFLRGGSFNKPAGLDSTKLSELLTKANAATDDAKRQELFAQLQKRLLAEAPFVWTFSGFDYFLVSSSVEGFQPLPDMLLTSLASTSWE